MATGTVKFFDAEKGFGFIIPDDKSVELFFHKSKLQDDIIASVTSEARVSYEVGEHNGKTFAKQINLIAPAPTKTTVPTKRNQKTTLEPEDEFEREWGLRRSP